LPGLCVHQLSSGQFLNKIVVWIGLFQKVNAVLERSGLKLQGRHPLLLNPLAQPERRPVPRRRADPR